MSQSKAPIVKKVPVKMLDKGKFADHPRENYIHVDCPGRVIYVRLQTAEDLCDSGKGVRYKGKEVKHMALASLSKEEKAVSEHFAEERKQREAAKLAQVSVVLPAPVKVAEG